MLKPSLCLLVLVACDALDDDGGYSNDPTPIASDDQVTIGEDQPLALESLTENDFEVNNVKVIVEPMHGTISNGQYVPAPGYFGTDEFSYEGRYSQYSSVVSRANVQVTITSDGLAYEQSRSLTETNASDLFPGDIDGDGKIDLVTCNVRLNEMTVFRNTSAGAGEYSVETYRFEGGNQPVEVAVADLDDDARLDIVTAAIDGLVIFRNITAPQGPLAFAAPIKLGSMQTDGVVATDLDGDGDADLAAIESVWPYTSSDGKLHVWLNTSTQGVFAFGTATEFTTPKGPFEIAGVDADGDTRTDLAVLSGEDKLSLFVNATGAGATVPAFQARVDRATAPDPTALFVVDLDRDNRSEIGVAHKYGILWVYANRGTQMLSFEAARVLDVPDAIQLIATAELDGDGVVDLIGVSYGTAPFAYLMNRSQPQTYDFEIAEAKIADVVTLKAASFATPVALEFVELDGAAPVEIVVASTTGSSSNGVGGLRVLYGP